MDNDATLYLAKAQESLQAAESEFANGRYTSCANRCYYACFQAAIAALLREGIRPPTKRIHKFVQVQFVGLLINRRKRYAPELRQTLIENMNLRHVADYDTQSVPRSSARNALARTRVFVDSIQESGSAG